MQSQNIDPYSSSSDLDPFDDLEGGCYRQGNLLIIPRNMAGRVPCDTCIKCGRPAVRVLRRSLYWYPPALIVLVVPCLIIFLIVVLIVQKKMRISVGLCEQHLAVRKRMTGAAWGIFITAVAAGFGFAYAPGSHAGMALLTVGGLVLVSLITASIGSRYPVSAKHISDVDAEVKGAGEGYLKQLPKR